MLMIGKSADFLGRGTGEKEAPWVLLILLIPYLLGICSQNMEIMSFVCLVKGQGPHEENLRAFGLSRLSLIEHCKVLYGGGLGVFIL